MQEEWRKIAEKFHIEKNFELILIDDGSTDCSCKICDGYGESDQRIRVIHKENTGVSDSRNLGLRMARGKYIQFLDSDDWLAPEACRLLFCAAEENQCDLVISDFYRVVDNRIERKGAIKKEGILSRNAFSAYLIERPSDFYYGVLWNKLFRREFIEQYKIYLNDDISWCEDIIFNLEYFVHMDTVYVLRVPIYYYVKNNNSLSNSGITLSRVIQTKTLVSEYYRQFCTQTLDHPSEKIPMHRFYMTGATDGKITARASKLGEERVKLNLDIVADDGIFSEQYLEEKCLEYCMKTTSYQFDLTTDELSVLFCIYQYPHIHRKKDIHELTQISKRKVKTILQKLRLLGYISWEENVQTDTIREKRDFCQFQILPEANPVIAKLESVEERYKAICFSGFTEEEKKIYTKFTAQKKNNMMRVLSAEEWSEPE